MKRFNTLMTGVSAIALVAAFATPTFAAKTVIEEEELDEVTAAGQPKIAQAYVGSNGDEPGVGDATAVNFQVSVFAAHISGQEGLTALTLNNIFGENQIANNVNIQAANSDSGANSGTQTNNATQSWGSSKAHGYVVVDGAPGGPAVCATAGIIAKCNAEGGDASDGKIGLLWEFADEIADSKTDIGDATSANVVITIVAGTFDEFAQTGLTALTVNNVFGFNQVANGLNISAGDLSGTGIDGAGIGTTTNQNNTSEQWRGSPKGFSGASTFF